MRFLLAQLNPIIGDFKGNSLKIKHACKKATSEGVNVVLTPELSLWGYPPRDLLLNPQFVKEQNETLQDLVNFLKLETCNLSVFVGIAEPSADLKLPNLFNSIALVDATGWEVIARKQLLPTYDVFDEKRYFRAHTTSGTVKIKTKTRSLQIGITICEDLWVDETIQGQRLSGPDPIAQLVSKEIDLLINLSASPFSHNKESLRNRLAEKAANRLDCPVIYLNQVGGNDELIFDGASFAINSIGETTLKLPRCQESIAIWEPSCRVLEKQINIASDEERLFQALVLGVHDYAKKCKFNSALIGLSGGIDSALVAIIAAAALGGKQISTVLMPSPWSSSNSIKDALALAQRVGTEAKILPIGKLMQSYDFELSNTLGKPPEGITAENLQSRIRGTLLMALANHEGHLLLSTGNKSELAVGYCTLYGDMNGGLAVIGDLYKTVVFALCKWLDSTASSKCRKDLGLPHEGELIGSAILEKPPSAELRPGQLDTDSLPDYEVLDPILKSLIEERSYPEELIKKGHDPNLVMQIKLLLKNAEFKRRQAPPLLKVSNQAFGSGWRIPIAAK